MYVAPELHVSLSVFSYLDQLLTSCSLLLTVLYAHSSCAKAHESPSIIYNITYMYEFFICEECQQRVFKCEFQCEIHDIIKQYNDDNFYCYHKFIEIFQLNA